MQATGVSAWRRLSFSSERVKNYAAAPAFLAQFASALAGFATVALLSRLLSPMAYGEYAVIIAVVSFSNAFIGTAIGTSMLGRAARRQAGLTLHPTAVFSAFAALALGIAPLVLYVSKSAALTCAALAVGGVFVYAEVSQGAMLGRYAFWRYLAASVIRSSVGVVLLVALIVLPQDVRLVGAVIVLAISAIAFSVLERPRVIISKSMPDAVRVASLSAVGATNLFLWVLATGDRVILGSRHGLAAVATYVALYGLIDRVLRVLMNSFAAVWLPASLSAPPSSPPNLARLARLRLFAALTVFACTVLGLSGGAIVRLITGGRFSPSLSLSISVASGVGLLCLSTPFYALLVARGYASVLAAAAGAAAIVNVTGNWVLDPRYGATAAGFLTAGSYGLYAGVASVAYLIVRRRDTSSKAVPPHTVTGIGGQ